ncbi:hypothetical protein VMF7928_03014 [Vibrio marisflavi CECT 7928]|uniref:Metallo-beta-lactamase domain-containing protein n=1 Tax=Vibrio marisflavi CECT 7928 TaxID=634439 RepID=A0ABN8E7J1_9VIBR|nr:hypothetical protein VMF7928_03014 [Vibrio marisflavi CECT 7928]
MPSLTWSLPTAVLIVVCIKYRRLNWFFGGGIALLVILLKGNQLYEQSHAIFQFGEHVTISAKVGSYFKKINHGYEGTVEVLAIDGQKLNYFEQGQIRLINSFPLSVGDEVFARIKLKRISGWLNEAGFDKESFYFSQGWLARASVIGDVEVTKKSTSLKTYLFNQVSSDTSTLQHRGLIRALLFGVRDEIPKEIWFNLQRSGLGHLLAISGLHIGIAYFVGYALGLVGSRCSKQLVWMPIFLGCLAALFYAWLADFSLSTQRALTMCLFNVVLLYSRLRISVWIRLLSTLAVVLTVYPFSFMSSGFWLSFVAVAVLFYVIESTENNSILLRAVKIQFSLIILMGPVSALFFQGISLSGFLYNLVFVPWVSFVVVPFLMLASCLSLVGVGSGIWQLSSWLFKPVVFATQFATYGWLPISKAIWLILLSATMLLLLYQVVSRSFVPLLSAILASNLAIADLFKSQPDWRIDILDVGHGLAILIEQQGRVVVYDTGGVWLGGSVVESVISPVLTGRGVSKIEGLILSHQDSDHAGGKGILNHKYLPKWVRSSSPSSGEMPCESGVSWKWKALAFDVLWPPTMVSRAFNPHSCVIRVHDLESEHSVLLAGDIESVAEWLIVRQKGELLASDIIVVPHHGSSSSSIDKFVSSVQPEIAVASLAKSNQWQLPNPEVVNRYKKVGANWLDTAESGQVTIEFVNKSKKISTLRNSQSGRWYRQMLRNGVE